MQKYQDYVVSQRGAVQSGVSVLVKTYPAGATATIYSDDGVTLAANPLTTDSAGKFSFYAADGRYSLYITGDNVSTVTVDDVLLEDPITPNAANFSSIGATTPGTGAFTSVDINGGTIDGAVIGGSSRATGNFTTLDANGNVTVGGSLSVTGNTTLGDASGDTVTIKAAAWTLTNSPTVTGTWANLGSVTTADINGGTIDGVTIGASVAPTVTNLGSVATCDINGGTIRSEEHTSELQSHLNRMPSFA